METSQGEGEHESMAGATKTNSSTYNDDEPVTWHQPAKTAGNGVLEISTHCEYPALPNDTPRDGFAVMVHVRAPAASSSEARRAPLDLVVVLDVSASMSPGAKLAQAKRAVGFVVDSLGPRDRLSVVAFSGDGGRRVTRLARMTEDGKAAAKLAVEALVVAADGDSAANARAGLDEAAKVLGGCRHWNAVAGVIFLSAGRDYTASDSSLVPEFLLRAGGWRCTPVHTFGLGPDAGDAAAAMHSIAEATGGTFSFVEDLAAVQNAVARCVAGLRSVTAQGVWMEVETWCLGVFVTAVKSGRYESDVGRYEVDVDEGNEATVNVGELYADEKRRFLFSLHVPRLDGYAGADVTLIKVRCSYLDMATMQNVKVDVTEACADVLPRPVPDTAAADVARCVEVERELLRVAAAEDMALARDAAERGDYAEAAQILDARRESLSRSAPALSGDAMCAAVAAELRELSRRVSDEGEYRKTGRACLLAAMSSHGLQRGASSPVWFGCGVGSTSMFATPAMRKMEKLSEMLRKQQEMPPQPPLPEDGSKTGVPPRSRLEARLASAVPRLSMLNRYRRLLLKR